MKKFYTLLVCAAVFAFSMKVNGQARIISTGGPYMVMDGGVYLVVENPNADALTNPAVQPDLNLVSEDEDNVVKWHLGSSTTEIYQVPFSNTAGENTRVIYSYPNAASAGVQGPEAHVLFSTLGTAADNWVGGVPNVLPQEVTHLTNLNLAIASPGTQPLNFNQLNTVDRYWFIEMIDYTDTPEPRLRFTSPVSERSAPNTITSASVMVQRFNSSMNQWADWLSPSTTIAAGNNTTGNVQIPDGEFYKTWTLTSFDEPLSVELLSFDAECENERATIRWSTASEQNSDFFSVERSTDGQFWETIETVQAAGNSSSLIDYVVYDESAKNGMNYYKVTETDIDGIESEYGPVSTSCGSNVFEIVNVYNDFASNSPLEVVINSSTDKIGTINIVDLTGKLVYSQANTTIQEGISTISIDKNNFAMGVYFIAIQTADELLGRKVVLN